MITLDDLNLLRRQSFTLFPNSDHPDTLRVDPGDQKHFQILIYQALHKLNIAPILELHPAMRKWYDEVHNLAPEIFKGRRRFFNLNLQCFYEQMTLEAKVNLAYSNQNPLLYHWGIRTPELQWHDKVRGYVTQEYHQGLPLQLIILAVHPTNPAQRIEVEWTPQLHEETEEWLRSLLFPQPMTPEPTLPSELWNIDLDQIPEVVL